MTLATTPPPRDELAVRLAQLIAGPGTTDEKLAAVRAARDSVMPEIITAAMDRGIDDLVASGIRSTALKVGEPIPAFSLPDLEGRIHSSQALLAKGPLVLSFFRGSWCPYCNIEVHGLNQALPIIQSLGASVLAVTPEKAERQLAAQESGNIRLPILYDEGAQVARKFGIVYELSEELAATYRMLGHGLEDMNGPGASNALPLPATYVIDRFGIVRLADVDEDYSKRLSPEAIVTSLRTL